MQTARDVVLDLLRRWSVLDEPPFLPERTDEVFAGLSARDRAFGFDLLTGVIRWRKCLDAVIQSRLRQTHHKPPLLRPRHFALLAWRMTRLPLCAIYMQVP